MSETKKNALWLLNTKVGLITSLFLFIFRHELSISNIDVILSLAILIYVPAFLNIFRKLLESFDDQLSRYKIQYLYSISAYSYLLAVVFEHNTTMKFLYILWLFFTGFLGILGVMNLFTLQTVKNNRSLSLFHSISLIFLSIGGFWLNISKFEFTILEITGQIPHLTAIHFHYAGFCLLSIITLFGIFIEHGNSSVQNNNAWSTNYIIGVVLSVLLIAIGITFNSLIELIGVIILVISVILSQLHIFGYFMFNEFEGKGPWFLYFSALSGIAAVFFGLTYGVSEFYHMDWISIGLMIVSHGYINGIAFIGFAVIGWNIIANDLIK